MFVANPAADGVYLNKIRKEFGYDRFPPRCPKTLYDVLDLLKLTKFKELLGEAGLLDLLKLPGNITLLVPINEAFDALSPLTLAELEGPNRAKRISTLARSHIVFGSLFADQTDKTVIQPNIDMNGERVDLDVTIALNPKFYSTNPLYFVNAIHGVRPLEPSPMGSVQASNGRIILVRRALVSKIFVQQKYADVWPQFFKNGEESKKYTTWEALNAVGLTKFCKLVERAGMVDLLQAPAEKANKLNVWAPIDEVFEKISAAALPELERDGVPEIFVKRHILKFEKGSMNGADLLGKSLTYDDIDILAGKFKSSNGNFWFLFKSLSHYYVDGVGWLLLARTELQSLADLYPEAALAKAG